MFLENIVIDAAEPAVVGRFWEALLDTTTLTDTADAFETRLTVTDGPVLDLCFPQVPEPAPPGPRVHLDVAGGAAQQAVVERALQLGATPLDVGQRDVAWVVLADPEGHPFCVLESRPAYEPSGPLAAIPVNSSDPLRDRQFWTELSGWVVEDGPLPAMRHRSGRGPLIEWRPERAAKGPGKNPIHLDLRLESGDDPDAVVTRIEDLGGVELHPDWGDLPWRVLVDPSGNEFCLLPARPG